jgi:hypothetical protein
MNGKQLAEDDKEHYSQSASYTEALLQSASIQVGVTDTDLCSFLTQP